jgi:hypothetical protein
MEGLNGTSERLAFLVTGGACALRGGDGDCRCLVRISPARACKIELEHDVEFCRARQFERALEQPGGSVAVAPPERSPAGGCETLARALRERIVGFSQLCLVADGLLEMVPENLVQLDEIPTALFQPTGDALVQIGPGRLRQRVVGGIANQEVAEAEAVLDREQGLVRTDQLLADERGEMRRHLAVLGERLHGAAVKELALNRSPLEH